MGCASSKQSRKCKHCRRSPVSRSYTMVSHRPSQDTDESYHVVGLTSSTLGSLKLDGEEEEDGKAYEDEDGQRRKEFELGMIEAKAWSMMIDQKIKKPGPKTPTITPPGEPETINAWELMEGLEDTSPLRPRDHLRSFSFHVSADPDNESGGLVSEFDPQVISAFKKALQNLSPENPFHLQKSFNKETNKRVVLYFTSLRGVRKTYEDCCEVRGILKALWVRVDERDVSMHSGFKDELRELLGEECLKGGLPRVFAGESYIGGAEEIRRLHEEGELERLLEDCERVEDGVCEGCGDARFVPCETCSGSCKIFNEQEEEEEDDEESDDQNEYGFQRCPDCNENGLIRCPVCCQ